MNSLIKVDVVAFDWFGRFAKPRKDRRIFKVQILRETNKRYEVEFLESASVIYAKGETALIPKWSCSRFYEPTNKS